MARTARNAACRRGAILASLVLAVACQAPVEHDRGTGFVGLDRRVHYPLDVRAAPAHVLLFVTDDCPIANSYAPEIGAIAEEMAATGLELFLVHTDPEMTERRAAEHARAFGYDRVRGPLTIVLDPEHVLVRSCGARTTPEAAVLTPDGLIAYRGRIDDAWADLGKRRRVPATRDLRAALADVLARRPVAVPRTEAVGCDIPEG